MVGSPPKLARVVLAAVGALAAILVAWATFVLAPYYPLGRKSWISFSSAESPERTFIAENAMSTDDFGGGRITVRRVSGPTVYEAHLADTAPSLFLKWMADDHLLVLSNSQSPVSPSTVFTNDRSLVVSYVTHSRLGAADASAAAKIHERIVLKPGDVIATFEEKPRSGLQIKSCALSLSARDGTKFGDIGMSIVAGVYSCASPPSGAKFCVGIASHFNVGSKTEDSADGLLTSATVSQIPSSNEMPDGHGYTAIRGSFGQDSAVRLIEAIKKQSFDIDYNFGFNERNIRYTIPTTGISAPLNDFEKCVGPAFM